MNDKQRNLMMEAAHALSDAKRLWPARHPAAGMIVGIEDDCREVYTRICRVQGELVAMAMFDADPPQDT